MNLYFLVEGKTEQKLYPNWLEHLIPSLERVPVPSEAVKNNYFLISGGGFPGLLDNMLVNSADDIVSAGNFEYFVIVLDAEEVTVQERLTEVSSRVLDEGIELGDCELTVVVQNRCIETWLLGNRSVFSRNPTTRELIDCVRFYNVFDDDPELMTKPPAHEGTTAAFHYGYLKHMLAERRIRYSKGRPGDTRKSHYVDGLKNRLSQTGDHLLTLRYFLNFCQTINREIASA